MNIYKVSVRDSQLKEVFFKELESALRYVYTEYVGDLHCEVDFACNSLHPSYVGDISVEPVEEVCSFKLHYEGNKFWNNAMIIIEKINVYDYDLERY